MAELRDSIPSAIPEAYAQGKQAFSPETDAQDKHEKELSLEATVSIQSSALRVILRDQTSVIFEASRIQAAINKAFIAVEGEVAACSERVRQISSEVTETVRQALMCQVEDKGVIHIESIQDEVERALMQTGEYAVAKAYVLYRDQHRQQREALLGSPQSTIRVMKPAGQLVALDWALLAQQVALACAGLQEVNQEHLLSEVKRNLFDKISEEEVGQVLVMSARVMIEKEPNYTYVAARLLLDHLQQEAFRELGIHPLSTVPSKTGYRHYFTTYLAYGIQHELLDPLLETFDLVALSEAFCHDRDQQFTYLGLQTLYDRYFLHHHGQRFELPQAFFMRVAMGLALGEAREERDRMAMTFYHLLSTFAFMSSTPTLFNAGTLRPQLSSCYLTTIPDDLAGIFSAIKDNALLSKYAGGLGNDWTNVRSMGSLIKGTNGKSQGVIPFLNVANATTVAVNQGGKRKGAVCAYLETWHYDIKEFLELRKNTGDDRRRTHDMNTANWIPDLFMKRLIANQEWTLFSPNDVPDLHDLYGSAFEEAYLAYEQQASEGKIKHTQRISAVVLWRKMLTMLFETGHPWITFKDACNLRSPQQHVGVIHSSNLCTEITLNTSSDEIAVCNLGSVNLVAHLTETGLDEVKLRDTVQTAIRLLDNVIDINYYSVPQAQNSNLKHRPIGLGIMGFQDALYHLRVAYASPEAVQFADYSMELISYYAIQASADLAKERGRYSSYDGSLWSQGILPIDSLAQLRSYRGPQALAVDSSQTLDWSTLRETVKQQGMRNSNVLAIAPTATISNICGVSQSIEPTYRNLFVKSNLSGEFTIINPYLVRELKKLSLWDDVMLNDLKYYSGSIAQIGRIPNHLKKIYATAFDIDQTWLIEAASRRQKWIDQSQSLNLYLAVPSGKKLDELYRLAWQRGLKTTYYLRSVSASDTEKVTIEDRVLNAVQATIPACSLTDPTCEACE